MIKQIKPLIGFFTHLSNREKFVLYITCAIVSVLIFDRLIMNPVSKKLKSLDTEIRDKESAIKKGVRILGQKDKILAESSAYQPLLAKAASDEEETISLLKEVELLANKSGINLIDLKPAEVKESASIKKYFVNLNCEAQMQQLMDFMHQIESSDKMLKVERFEINPKSKESSIATCGMSVSRIVVP